MSLKYSENYTPLSMGYNSKNGGLYNGPSYSTFSSSTPKTSLDIIKNADLNNLSETRVKTITFNGKPTQIQETIIKTGEEIPFCNDGVSIDPVSSEATSLNQNLTRGENPKTLLKPVVVAPSYDLSYWRADNFIIPTSTNKDRVQEDMYLSGYAESTCCGYLGPGSTLDPIDEKIRPTIVGGTVPLTYNDFRYSSKKEKKVTEDFQNIKENFHEANIQPMYINPSFDTANDLPRSQSSLASPSPNGSGWNYAPPIPSSCQTPKGQSVYRPPPAVGGYPTPWDQKGKRIVSPSPTVDKQYVPMLNTNPKDSYGGIPKKYSNNHNETVIPKSRYSNQNVIENYDPLSFDGNYADKETIEEPDWVYIQPNQPGWVNTTCGYDPSQTLNAGLPSNLPVGNCDKDPRMKTYNENIFTSIVTPGVYTRTQVNEPINSNIGISFQQQFEPTTCRRDDKGLHYLQHDPRIIEPATYEDVSEIVDDKADYGNVYDPRFYGYGTSYRSYHEPVTGQTRFMYDDVNAIKMPNYVTRNKLDFLPYADSYGPIQKGEEFGNIHNPNIRTLAQDSWMRNSLEFRNDLTERQMRKNNAIAWQRRVAPFGANPVGSNKK